MSVTLFIFPQCSPSQLASQGVKAFLGHAWLSSLRVVFLSAARWLCCEQWFPLISRGALQGGCSMVPPHELPLSKRLGRLNSLAFSPPLKRWLHFKMVAVYTWFRNQNTVKMCALKIFILTPAVSTSLPPPTWSPLNIHSSCPRQS